MKHAQVKICGLRDEAALAATILGGADMAGFVHFGRSPRHLDFRQMRALIDRTRGRIQSVILLVDPDDAAIDEALALRPDWLQLHGRESPSRVTEIAGRGPRIIKALRIDGSAELATAAQFSAAGLILLDAAPANATLPGGTGERFDWHWLTDIPLPPYLLAGGVHAGNVAAALATGAAGVDVSSGVEVAPGIKSADKIRAFIAAVRAAESALPEIAK